MNYLILSSFGQVMSYIGYIALAILILLIMITVHEFGHYIAGKIFGFGIDEFAVGFGPKIFSRKKKNGELFSVRALPIGGFCAFRGEDDDSDDPTAFNNKKWWQRIIVLISGAFMNYLLALVVIIIMFSCYGKTTLVAYKMQDRPSEILEEYCFQERDIILSSNGKNIYLVTDLMNAVKGKEKGDKVNFTVRRGNKEMDIKVELRTSTHFENVEDMKGLYSALGIYYQDDGKGGIKDGGIYATSIKFGFFETIGRSLEYSIMLAGTVFTVLGQLITGALGIGSLGGTVTTIAVTADAIKLGGLRQILNMMSFIGVNLAVFNLLPFPALDGSRVVFTAIEGVRRKPLNRRIEGLIHTIGLFALLLFAVFVDLQQCF
ncbi:MAG: PDZ domain-containing protein [Clostridiales bacterium]|nr:PDZ domain-containing protein [Clostridiales bacterium]